MKKLMKPSTLSVLIIFGSSSLACAQGNAWDGPKTHKYKDVPYISGGIGIDERSALRAMAETDNLEMSFALQDKEYLGGAKVLIKDNTDRVVLDATSDGPLLYAKLPQGAYTIMATANGTTQFRKVTIPEKGKAMVYFAWKEANQQFVSHRASPGNETVAYHK